MANTPVYHSLRIGSATHVGRVRAENQDAWGRFPNDLLKDPEGEKLFVVADGMGGHADGRLASNTAVQTIGEQFFGQRIGGIASRLETAFMRANSAIHAFVKQLPAGKTMGTTCTALAISGDRAFVGHIGDSRMYRFHKGKAKQVTEDHTMIGAMVKKGILTEQEAARHPQRSLLERALGPESDAEPEVYEIDRLKMHDIFVLCSDGLAEVKMEEVGEIVQSMEPQAAAEQLVALANERGGMDNVTVQVVQVVAAGEGAVGVFTIEADARPLASASILPNQPAPAVQTGVFNALTSPPDWQPPPPSPLNQPAPPTKSKKWVIPTVAVVAGVGIGTVIWASMDRINTVSNPNLALQNESWNAQAYERPQGSPSVGNSLPSDDPIIRENTPFNLNNGDASPTTSPTPSGTSVAAVKPSPSTPSAVTNTKPNPNVEPPDLSAEPANPPTQGVRLMHELNAARKKLNAKDFSGAVLAYEALKESFGSDPAYKAELNQAAKKLMAEGDAMRGQDKNSALEIYRLSKRLVNSDAIESRISNLQDEIKN